MTTASSAEEATETSVENLNEGANNTAESPAADDQGAKQPASMLEAVQAAANPTETEDKPEDTPAPGTEVKDEEEASPNSAATENKGAEEDDDPPPFHKHPRWQKMLSENREFKQQLESVEPLKQKAEQFDNLQRYLDSRGMTDEEMNAAFELSYMMRHEPQKAYEILKPFVQNLQQMAGEALPPDLAEAVEAGRIDEETAKQYAKSRSEASWLKSRDEDHRKRADEERQRQEQAAQVERASRTRSAVVEWEQKRFASDPDFQKKQPLVRSRVAELVRAEGVPATPEEAVKLTDRALKDVEGYLSSILPKPQTVREVTGGSSGRSAPQPKSLQEAVRLAANGGAK